MAQLILIRHSAVVVDASVPQKEWRLSETGRASCRRLATALRVHAPGVLVSSTEPKAIETAELVAKRLRIETRTAPDLDEHRRPFVDPDEFERLMARFFADATDRVFGEESADEVRNRFAAAIDAVLASEAGRNAAIVSHGTAIAVYAAPMFGIGAAALWQRLQQPSFLLVDTDTATGLRIVDEIE